MNHDMQASPHDEDETRNLSAIQEPLHAEQVRRDYVMQAAPWVAGGTDIGRRHHLNQDSIALWADPSRGQRAVMVVSDGVSSSPHAERASQTAANTVRELLASRLAQGTFDQQRAHEVFDQVFEAANRAVLEDGRDGRAVGSCTLVAAVIDDSRVSIANIGDTRAYWLPDNAPGTQLSIDDSVAQAQMDLGMSREEAETSIHAHAITKWLGPEAVDLEPRTVAVTLQNPGWLIVCSDGLWNYCSEANSMATLVGQLWHQLGAQGRQSADALASALLAWANGQGGRDNISVCLARLEPETRHNPR